jgi:hypothetical protein
MSSAVAGSQVFGPVPTRTRTLPWDISRSDQIDTTLVNFLTLDLVLAVLCQKMAFPCFGSQLELVALTNFGVIGWLFYKGRIQVSALRCALYLLTFGPAIILQFLGPEFSIGSYFLTCLTGLPLLTVFPANMATYMAVLRRFQILGVIVVGLVFLDHVLQLAGPGMPDLEKVLPAVLTTVQYNYIQPLYWNSPYSKPNAIFFLEASTVSQFTAMALIIEVAFFQRIRLILLYGAGLMAVFAGTGFVLVFLTAPVLALKYIKPRFMLLGLLLVAIAAGVAFATGWADIMTSRTAEFDKAGSSGNARFVAPFEAIGTQFRNGSEQELLTGDGAGMQPTGAQELLLFPFVKILLEYGVIVLVFYMTFSLYCIFGSGVPFVSCWMICIYFQLLNGSSSMPLIDIYTYVLVAGYQIIPASVVPRRRGLDVTDPVPAVRIGPSPAVFG